ncbi:alpha/beta fold hydrolase [Marinomonas aquiplantarum]|uniref:Sigma-B regulation protein RsbQ n=1 Tax=Marinomonas aquiplantarum TaxID=491951 RepID=A0A366CWZ3_9GAMM|nr:alpha/beta hydrolase [Marinomonas aquiplantarum]RBO82333.1 sigma-B regulation protein RsbQ [Marinomonas aquiplantarum]
MSGNHKMILDQAEITKRNNVKILGEGQKIMIMAHGFGCNQTMWRFLLPQLTPHYKIVLFDYVGCGSSDCQAYREERYNCLDGYAQDIIEICDAFDLQDCIFVGHSISATIGWIINQQRPELISHHIMVCPSPCFINIDDNYSGGFDMQDLEGLIGLMSQDYLGWGQYLAPIVMGSELPDDASQADEKESMVWELLNSFCAMDVTFSLPFAKACFYSDNRHLLKHINRPSLILQSSDDLLVNLNVAEFMANEIPDNQLDIIESKGHCLHMTNPANVMESMKRFLATQSPSL